MTTQREAALDLILETRLDVLGQVVDESNDVLAAMKNQRCQLEQVETFLTVGGTLPKAESDLLVKLGDAANRLEVELENLPRLGGSVRRIVGMDPTGPQSDRDRAKRIWQTLRFVQAASRLVRSVGRDRAAAYQSFENVRRWSMAGLDIEALEAAIGDYEQRIRQIRTAADPWDRYEAEMPRGGHELFFSYVELLAGMAVRGSRLDADVAPEVDDLLKSLLPPPGGAERPADQNRSPLALMGVLAKRHRPLGYPGWSLWALPLVGRTAGEFVVRWFEDNRWIPALTPTGRLLCADLYAQYALGPSYAHAAVFLDLEPVSPRMNRVQSADPERPVRAASEEGEPPADSVRADLLLEKLPQLGGGAKTEYLGQIADRVRREWSRARAAAKGAEAAMDGQTRQAVEVFLDRLPGEFPEPAYDIRRLEEIAEIGHELPGIGEQPDRSELVQGVPKLRLKDLLTAMWLTRMENPKQARLIHKGANAVMKQGPPPPAGRQSGRVARR